MSDRTNYLVSYFTDLKNTHFNGRYYTIETLNNIIESEKIGLDLKVLGIYPIDFDKSKITEILKEGV
jgi:hypothetical protein